MVSEIMMTQEDADRWADGILDQKYSRGVLLKRISNSLMDATQQESVLTVKKAAAVLKTVGEILEHEAAVLDDFHRYAQMYGTPGHDVFKIVLGDALRFRGTTLERLRVMKP